MKNLNQIIIENISKRIPPCTKVVSYLMDTLQIGKDPAYKRVRGVVPFTIEEAITIATDLNFSLDVALMQSDNNYIVGFNMPVNLDKSSTEIYANMLESSIKTMKEVSKSQNYEIISTFNFIPWFLLPFPTLFKIAYCRYLNECNELPYNVSFSEIVIPEQIIELQQKTSELCMGLKNVTCICGKNIVEKSIKRINYLRKRDFLTKKDLMQIQQEFYIFFDTILLINSTYREHYKNFQLYISEDTVDSNGIYYQYGEEEICAIYYYPEMPIFIKNNPLISQLHKKWINAQIKFSTLLTRNNEMKLFQFNKEYRTIVATLTDEK